MLRLRAGLLITLLLLTGCDHHKPANQSLTGSAAAGPGDSSLTGLPPVAKSTAGTNYPRATLVSLPLPTESQAPGGAPPPAMNRAVASQPAPAAETPAVAASTPPADNTPPPVNPPPDSSSAAAASSSSMPQDSSSTAAALNSTPPTDSTTTIVSPPVPASPPPPAPEDDADSQKQVIVLTTTLGNIVIQFDDVAAPRTCGNFRKLVSDGFYDHTVFHRVIPNFMIQGGDPNSKSDDRSSFGQGGPGYTLPAEINLKHERGAVAMARLPDSVNPKRESNGSQFYICVADCPSLDGNYTVFAHVIKGMDVVDKIAAQPRDAHDNPLTRIEMQASLEPKSKALQEASASNP